MNKSSTTVIIPAFNEEAVINATLTSLLEDALPGEFEVIVVCNGCTDKTAQRARAAGGEVRVIELGRPSKTTAINTGLRLTKSPKVVLLDSDIVISTTSCRLLVNALDTPGTDAAIGHMKVNDQGCSFWVRAFYRVWSHHPYLINGKFAAAIAMTRAALDRIGELPDIIADDGYLQRMVPRSRVSVVRGVSFVANAPRKLSTLIRVRSRIHRGNRQLDQVVPLPPMENGPGLLATIMKKPSLWPDLPVYLSVVLASRVLSLTQSSRWERDVTTRQPVTE